MYLKVLCKLECFLSFQENLNVLHACYTNVHEDMFLYYYPLTLSAVLERMF